MKPVRPRRLFQASAAVALAVIIPGPGYLDRDALLAVQPERLTVLHQHRAHA